MGSHSLPLSLAPTLNMENSPLLCVYPVYPTLQGALGPVQLLPEDLLIHNLLLTLEIWGYTHFLNFLPI